MHALSRRVTTLAAALIVLAACGSDAATSTSTPERLDILETDVIFATNPDAESGGAIATDRGAVEGLWAALPAVRNGMQFDVLDSTWMTGIGVIGANKILDDLEAQLG